MVWLSPDLPPARAYSVFGKVAALCAVFIALALFFVFSIARRWSFHIAALQRFITSPLDAPAPFPEGGPSELDDLSHAIKAAAERDRRVIDRANLEISRRETILAAIAEGVLAVDSGLKVIFCNDAFAQTFGIRTPLLENRPLYEIVREPALRDILERVLRGGTAETDRFQLPAAGGRWFEARALPLSHVPLTGAVLVLRDITELQRQEQVRKDFVADVSHELRTPLAAIRGYAETLLDGALDDANHNRKFVEIMLAQTIRLNNIASDLLILSELDSGLASGEPETVSVADVVSSAFHTVEREASLRGVRLNRDHVEDCNVSGFRFRLEQALVNLLDNAVKFNRPGGDVTVECTRDQDGRVRVSVRDTGVGVASEDLKRIFERFYRVDKARARSAGGTGLGLPIVKEIVQGMGGSVHVESQLGKGSTFTIVLQSV